VDGDRERWNARWRERAAELEDASPFLVENAALLRTSGKALDLAGGAGRNAVWLARRGFETTLVDVSDVALDKAEQRAKKHGVDRRMRFLRVDLEGPMPLAPLFDLVVVAHYLDRERRDTFVELLVPDGVLVAANPTVTNLERHERPSARFLVERGELTGWVSALGLELLASGEDWNVDGVHEAHVVARKPRPAKPIDDPPHDAPPSDGPYR
jgi:2-polyprenyl-3-methyl-5-hydroxy-6-metoxy-1,4-benzoquinol methylase